MALGRWLVFNTSVYIMAIRAGLQSPAFVALANALPRTYLASVVSAEVLGNLPPEERKVFDNLLQRLSKLGVVKRDMEQGPGAELWIQPWMSEAPSSCTRLLPSSGILTATSCELIRAQRIESSGLPGTTSKDFPPEPAPAATGGLQ